jgi:hypothetical protein
LAKFADHDEETGGFRWVVGMPERQTYVAVSSA